MPLPDSPRSATASFPAQPSSHSRAASVAVWGLALWLATVGNLPLWQKLLGLDQSLGQRGVLLAALGLMVWGGTAALLSLLHWPRLYRLLATALVVVTAFNSYFMWQFKAVIDSTMMANVLHTDANEVRDLMSWQLVACVLLIVGPALWWIWRQPMGQRSAWQHVSRNAVGALVGIALAVVAALAGYQGLSSLMRNHKDVRFMINPLNSVYGSGVLLVQQLPRQVQALKTVGEDAQLGASYAAQARGPLLLLVVGETARAQNWQLNGYPRATTPQLAEWQAQGGLVNFSQATSCGTNTQVSVPCMFSPLTREEGGNKPAHEENLLDVLQRAGLAVLWLENQSGCKGVCARVPYVDTRILQLPKLCGDAECADLVMLDGLDARIEALDPARRAKGVVVVMHQMGSHGPAYFRRRPLDQRPFQPECKSATLSDCPREQLINAYDNTLVQTDAFLDGALRWLKARADQATNDTGLIYMSDHGESLGENGLYLHGLPYAFAPVQQTHIPMVSWLSPGLQTRSRVVIDCLRKRSAEPVSHDNLFHSVLGLMDVTTQVYSPALDAFAPCTAK
ncbi:MAG: phosphoethanolamine--lipid A transferase [Hydrogenophaga sp.]